MHINYEGNRLSLSAIFKELLKHKLINFILFLLFILLGLLYYKYAQPVFKTSATLEVRDRGGEKALLPGLTESATDLQTDMDILRSKLLIKKSLKTLNNFTSVYRHNGFKRTALYKNAPFAVKHFIVYNPKIYDTEIYITDLGNGHFRLAPKRSLKEKILIMLGLRKATFTFPGTYSFGKPLVTDDIALMIERRRPFAKGSYSFAVHNPPDAVDAVRKRLSVAPVSFKSNILELTFRDHNPRRARDFLNMLIKHFMRYTIEDRILERENKLNFINEQLERVKSKLLLAENRMEHFKVSNNIADLQTQMQEVVQKAATLEEELGEEKIRYKIADWLDREIRKGNYPVLNSLGERYPAILEMTQTLQKLQEEKARLQTKYTDVHPEIISINKSIQSLEESIRRTAFSLRRKTAKRIEALAHDLALYKGFLREFPVKEKELGRIKRVFNVNDNVYNYLLRKQSELSLQNLTGFSSIKVLDLAHVPLRPISPKLGMILAISTLFSLLAMLLYAILRIRRDTIVKDLEDVSEITDIPIYGMIPYVKSPTLYNRAYVITDPGSQASEAFRTIRTNLEYVDTESPSKTVLVTSSVPNEGKTVVASNLAAIIAMGEKKTILLSMDLRKPQIHHKFGLPNKAGMSEVLAGKEQIENVTWKHKRYENLHIVTSGRIPPNPAELLASRRTEELLEALRKNYDYIIIDTPPVQYVSDAINLFKYSDINLFVVKSEFTEKRYVAELDKLVRKLKLKHSGIILNSVPEKYQDKKYFDKKYIFYEYL